MKLIYFIGLLLFIPAFSKCDQVLYKKTSSGIEYRYIFKGSGKKAEYGDHIFFTITRYLGDSLIYNTPSGGLEEIVYKKQKNEKPFNIEDIYDLAVEGDSIITRVSIDSLKKNPLNNFSDIPAGTYARIIFKIEKILSEEEAKKEKLELSKKQSDMDKTIIKDYVKTNNLNGTYTDNGVFVSIRKKGNSNKNIKNNDDVSLYYVGKLLDGTIFDKNWEDGKPVRDALNFKQGKGMLIPGFEEGLSALNHGAEATIIIPSSLAYGERGAGNAIPPNSVIMFNLYIQE